MQYAKNDKHAGKLSRPNLSELAADEIRKSIITGKLNPGEQVHEVAVAHDLGISRTPVKLALNNLSSEGLIEIIPRRGAFVRKFSDADLIDMYQIRGVLEGLAARLLTARATKEVISELRNLNKEYWRRCTEYGEAKRAGTGQGDSEIREADLAFHKAILSHAGSTHLADFAGLRDIEINSLLFTEKANSEETLRRSHAQHGSIADAIADGRPEQAETISRTHIAYVTKLLEEKQKNE